MKNTWIFLALFWILIISYPEFLAYLIGGLFLFIGLNIILFNLNRNNSSKNSNKDEKWSFFKVWKYKIYK